MVNTPYKVIVAKIDGTEVFWVSGPGCEGYVNGMTDYSIGRFTSFESAKEAARCANEAYRIGYEHAKIDVRRVLGVEPKDGNT